MPLEKSLKTETIAKYARDGKDTGSPEVQIAVMQARIAQITEHLKANPKDNHSLRGLSLLVGKRRRLEGYLKRKDITKYREVMKQIGIREVKPR